STTTLATSPAGMAPNLESVRRNGTTRIPGPSSVCQLAQSNASPALLRLATGTSIGFMIWTDPGTGLSMCARTLPVLRGSVVAATWEKSTFVGSKQSVVLFTSPMHAGGPPGAGGPAGHRTVRTEAVR